MTTKRDRTDGEPVSLHGPTPEDVLRALLAVNPDDPPDHDDSGPADRPDHREGDTLA